MNIEEIYFRFISLLKEEEKMNIERKYIPELMDEDCWELNSKDNLPEIKFQVRRLLKARGIGITIEDDFIVIYRAHRVEPDSHYSI